MEELSNTASVVDVAVDADGNALVLAGSANTPGVEAVAFTGASGWSSAERIDDVDRSVYDFEIEHDGSDFVALWAQAPAETTNLYTNRYDGDWGPPEILSDGITNVISATIALGSDQRGNLLATFHQGQGLSLEYLRYSRLTGSWETGDSLADLVHTSLTTVSQNGMAAVVYANREMSSGPHRTWIRFFE